jgi:hypothetical protein
MRNLEIKSMETNKSHCSYHGWQTDHASDECPCICYYKCMCYKCCKYGHIQRECLNQQVKKEKKATPRRECKVFYLNGKCRITPWTLTSALCLQVTELCIRELSITLPSHLPTSPCFSSLVLHNWLSSW